MRDINTYESDYLNIDYDFSKWQMYYRQKKILEILGRYPHRNILEIGCGTNPTFQFISDYEKYVVIEPSKSFYNNALDIIEHSKKKSVEIINNFFENTLEILEANSYDYIIISSLLHEVDDQYLFLQTLQNVCDKETVVHINVPNALSLHRILAKESGLISSVYDPSERNIKLQQNRVYDMNSLISDIKQVFPTFTMLENGSYFVKPFTHHQMGKLLTNEIIGKEVLDGLYNLIKYMPEFGSEIYVNFRK